MSRNIYNISALRKLLCLVFAAIVLPIGALIWHAYNQLRWESFHQFRTHAEELSARVDRGLADLLAVEGARPSSDFAFFKLNPDIIDADNTNADKQVLDRSPLSVFPPVGESSGILGYFQIDEEGQFSSPLLPTDTLRSRTDISEQERAERALKESQIREILRNNQLIESPVTHAKKESLTTVVSPANSESAVSATKGSVNSDQPLESPTPESVINTKSEKLDSQVAFDQLKKAVSPDTSARTYQLEESRPNVSELKLDSSYERKSQDYEKRKLSAKVASRAARTESKPGAISASGLTTTTNGQDSNTGRIKTGDSQAGDSQAGGTMDERGDVESFEDSLVVIKAQSDSQNDIEINIQGFNDEVGPIEFSMLNSGHFILFRSAWVESNRLIQGLLLDQSQFLDYEVHARFRNTGLSNTSDLVVAFDDEILMQVHQRPLDSSKANDSTEKVVLLRRTLASPFGRLKMVYFVSSLPPGPGARVLFWVTLVLASVLCGGFYLLYRTGLKQIALSRQQQNFVSSVSHELKTPLTSIRMYSEILKEGWADEVKKQEYYSYIHDESERLSRLIANVLKLSSINNSDIKLELRPMTVHALSNQLQQKIDAQLQPSKVIANYYTSSDMASTVVKVDEDSFYQVVINLVDNAVKFSKKEEIQQIDIKIIATREGDVMFAVRDYGPGVPRDQLKKIFELFYRSENELTRETVGTGIGLAIVKHLVTRMNGTIDVINLDPGAEFQIILPAHPVDH